MFVPFASHSPPPCADRCVTSSPSISTCASTGPHPDRVFVTSRWSPEFRMTSRMSLPCTAAGSRPKYRSAARFIRTTLSFVSTTSTASTMPKSTASISLRCSVMVRIRSSSCSAMVFMASPRAAVSSDPPTGFLRRRSPPANDSAIRRISLSGRASRREINQLNTAASAVITRPAINTLSNRLPSACSTSVNGKAMRTTATGFPPAFTGTAT